MAAAPLPSARATIPAGWFQEDGDGEAEAARPAEAVTDADQGSPTTPAGADVDPAASGQADAAARRTGLALAARLATARTDLLAALAGAAPGRAAPAAASVLLHLQLALADVQADLAAAEACGRGR